MTSLTLLPDLVVRGLDRLPLALDPVPQPEDVQPGWITLVVVVLLVVASLLLWFSMRKQLRKIQVPREGDEQSGDAGSDRGSDRTAADNDHPADPPVS